MKRIGPYSRLETDEEFRARVPRLRSSGTVLDLDAWNLFKKQRRIVWVVP